MLEDEGTVMKYTLFCKRGSCFRADLHFLYIGDWVSPTGFVILQHGLMSEKLLHDIMSDGFARVFLDHRYHTCSLVPWCTDEHQRRISDIELLQQYAGRLIRVKKRLFVGRIRL